MTKASSRMAFVVLLSCQLSALETCPTLTIDLDQESTESPVISEAIIPTDMSRMATPALKPFKAAVFDSIDITHTAVHN